MSAQTVCAIAMLVLLVFPFRGRGGRVTVRVNTQTLPLYTRRGQPFDPLKAVKAVRRAGSVQSSRVQVGDPQ